MRRLASLQTHQGNTATNTATTRAINDNPEERKQKLLLLNQQPQTTNQELNFPTGGRSGRRVDGDVLLGGGYANHQWQRLDINNNNNNTLNQDNKEKGDQEEDEDNRQLDKENMGSNVSRHNGKGLTGRRSLSSGE